MEEKQLKPTTSTAISSSSTKHVFLHEWWLVNDEGKGGSSGGLAVGGFARRDAQRVILFRSAPISKRLNTTAVLTRDGISITLNGLINLRHTTNNGYSMKVCYKFMVGFPYDWDDYATYHAHLSCGPQADVSDENKCYSNLEKNVKCRSSLEDVPVTSIRDMPMRTDLKNLMDDILAKAGIPIGNDERHAKFVAKRCLKASHGKDEGGYNHDQVSSPEADMVIPSKKEQNICLQGVEDVFPSNQAGVCTRSAKRCLKASPVIDVAGYNHDQVSHAEADMVTPSKKEQNTCLQGEEAVCSPNQAGVSTRSVKKCLEASHGKDDSGYNHILLETASSKTPSPYIQPEKAVNCHIRMTYSARKANSVPKASLIKGMAGQDQDQDRIVTPLQTRETVFGSYHQTRISPRHIESCLRASTGIDATGRNQDWLPNTDVETGTSSRKRRGVINSHSRTGVSTRSMTRLKKHNG